MKYRFEKYWRTCEVAEIEAQSFEEALEIVKKEVLSDGKIGLMQPM